MQRVLRHVALVATGGAVSGLCALAALALATRALTPEAFGLLAMAQAFAFVMERIGTFQPWQALIQFGAEARSSQQPATMRGLVRLGWWLDAAGGVTTAVLGLAAVTLLGSLLAIPTTAKGLALAYVAAFVLRPAGTAIAVLRLYGGFRQTALARAAGQAARLAGAVICLTAQAPLMYWVALWILADLAPSIWQNVAGVLLLRREGLLYGTADHRALLVSRFPTLWRTLWTTNAHAIVKGAVRDVDVLVVGALLGPAGAAVTRVVRQLGSAIGQLGDPLYQVMYPELADAAATQRHAEFSHVFRRTVLGASLLAAFILVACWGAGGWILEMSSGASYRSASLAFAWYGTAQAIGLALVPLSPALLALGGATASLRAVALASVVYLSILVPLVQHFGATGAGLAQLVFMSLWAGLAAHALDLRWRSLTPTSALSSPLASPIS